MPIPMLLDILWHPFVWLSRIDHSRGYGVQSPTDYAFVRTVVCEHGPYYRYAEIGGGWLERRLHRLYFRLANWRQPEVVEDAGRLACWQMGCRRARVTNRVDGPVQLMRLAPGEADWTVVDRVLQRVDDHSVLVVENLRRQKDIWRRLLDDERTVVTFDLYYCGIVMFDRKRQKQSYIVNF